MLKELTGPPANPASFHSFGRDARSLLSNARSTVASFFKVKPEEIIFTSGGTEGLNYLLQGIGTDGHIITTEIEHSAIHKTLKNLESKGLKVTYLPVDLWGAPLPDQIESAILPTTKAIILSAANSETGVKIDLEKIGSIAEKKNIPFLVDAVAYIGKDPFILPNGVTALVIAAHKFHGPKGIGAVFVRSGSKFAPLIHGGNQENMRRAGTINLAGAIGIAEAIQILNEDQEQITKKISKLRDRFEQILFEKIPNISINGEGARVSNTSNIAFHDVDGETLLMHLDLLGIAASHGSTCSTGALEPSRVLTSMGISRKIARSSIRFSFSRMNTEEEIKVATKQIADIVTKLRQMLQ